MKDLATQSDCLKCSYECLHKVLNKDEFNFINHNKIEMTFSVGEKILRQGSFVAQFAYLKEGVAKKVIEGKNNRNTVIKIITKGDYMALSILGNPDIYPFSIIALSECKVCYIRKETFVEMFSKIEKANQFLLQWNAENNAYLYEKLNAINTRNSHGKLAFSLVYLAKKNFSENIFNYLSRKDLAELSSISLESVNKILLQLKNDGIITINEDGLKIARLDLIERLSTVG